VSAAEVFAENAQAQVTAGGTTAPTPGTVETWTISGSTLPACTTGVSQCHVADPAAPSEKVLVTNISGSTATVTRGSDGTTPVAHAAGFTAVQVVPASWFSSVSNASSGLSPSGDTTGATDTAAIQALLNLGVYQAKLSVGKFYQNAPLVCQVSGQQLIGSGGATGSGNDASADLGTTLVIVAGFTNASSWHTLVTGAICVIQPNIGAGGGGANPAANQTNGVRIRDLWIDATSSPASVDGIASYGSVGALQLERVGCYKVTGKSYPAYNDSSWSSGNTPDGQHFYSCMAQACHDHAFYGTYADAVLIDCHAQNSQGSGAGYGDGFYFTSGNNRLVGCRSDLNANGFTFDAFTTGGGFYESQTLVGCGTQGNASYGLNVVNSSTTGTSARSSVSATGCAFEQDGLSSLYASGRVMVTLDNCYLTAGDAFSFNTGTGSPAYCITCAGQGSSPGHPTVYVNGGVLNPITGVVSGFANASQLTIGGYAQYAIGLTPAWTSYAVYTGLGASAASFASTPAAPTGTTSTTLVMAGLGSTWAFTPGNTGKVLVTVTGGSNVGTALTYTTVGARYGTGTAPANGAAVTGTRFGAAGDPSFESGATGHNTGFAFTAVLPLTAGTAYWFDLALATGNASDTAVFSNLAITITELAQ
jgi:hypothetical protein